ncbi:hypothetical protein GCM10010360_34770 [Streptomyces nogalater]
MNRSGSPPAGRKDDGREDDGREDDGREGAAWEDDGRGTRADGTRADGAREATDEGGRTAGLRRAVPVAPPERAAGVSGAVPGRT